VTLCRQRDDRRDDRSRRAEDSRGDPDVGKGSRGDKYASGSGSKYGQLSERNLPRKDDRETLRSPRKDDGRSPAKSLGFRNRSRDDNRTPPPREAANRTPPPWEAADNAARGLPRSSRDASDSGRSGRQRDDAYRDARSYDRDDLQKRDASAELGSEQAPAASGAAAKERAGIRIEINKRRPVREADTARGDQASTGPRQASPSPGSGRSVLPPAVPRTRAAKPGTPSDEQEARPAAKPRPEKDSVEHRKPKVVNDRWHNEGKQLKRKAEDLIKKRRDMEPGSAEYQRYAARHLEARVHSAIKFCLWGCYRGPTDDPKKKFWDAKSVLSFAYPIFEELKHWKEKPGHVQPAEQERAQREVELLSTALEAVLSRTVAVTRTRILKLLKPQMEKVAKEDIKVAVQGVGGGGSAQASSPANADAKRAKGPATAGDCAGAASGPSAPDSTIATDSRLADAKNVARYSLEWLNAWERVTKLTHELNIQVDGMRTLRGKAELVSTRLAKIGSDGGLQDLEEVDNNAALVMKAISDLRESMEARAAPPGPPPPPT